MSSQQSVDGNPPPTKKLKPDAGTTAGDTTPFTTVTMATPVTLISTNVTNTNNLQQGSVISVTFSNGECQRERERVYPKKWFRPMNKRVYAVIFFFLLIFLKVNRKLRFRIYIDH